MSNKFGSMSKAAYKKAEKTALLWMESEIRVCLTDCSDSMHEAESLKSKFDGIMEGAGLESDLIVDFIKSSESLLQKYAEELQNPDYEDCDIDDPTVKDLPIPASYVRKYMKQDSERED